MTVTRLSFPYGESIQWFSPNNITDLPTQPFKEWLLSTCSLTKKLKLHCSQFEVKVLGEDSLVAPIDEELSSDKIWVREVLLILDGTPWIFARTLIPGRLLDKKQDFLDLGDRPLGELLYSADEFVPGRIEVAHFEACSKIAKLAESLQQDVSQPLWGRRRYFQYQSEQLVVSEVFLPAAQHAIEQLS
ncbi:putative chorismate pyruvate-lyase [Shewanella sairae]|uniref:Probable chorismate pyruvate-lyase n=1 Tax=Shewanella sairae TaxID=190310 RepID=A0ABQ4P3R7_9GAMM|nr:chorismate lyase [Shewanella sairae]MCL1128521.1 chorismate lyase [Shewanella sairae]GIU42154.1 putative chorismate pyruvate-lyase [Shewanella sairae]